MAWAESMASWREVQLGRARVDSACSERNFIFRPERKISAERLDFISGAERLSSRNNRTQANRNAAGNEMEPRKWHARRSPPVLPPAPRTPRRTPPRHPVPHPPPTARQRPFTPRWRPTPNTSTFRCFDLAGALQFSCPVCYLASVWLVRASMRMARVSRRVWRAVPRAAGRNFPPPGRSDWATAQERLQGAYTMTSYFPVTVSLVTDVCGNFGRAFCSRGECRSRPGMLRV